MRKLVLLPCLFLLFVAATSCSDDNDDQEMMETAALVGKWNEVNHRAVYFDNGEKEEEEYTENDENYITTITFKSDGTFSVYTYRYDNSSTLNNPEYIEKTETGTYSTEGDKLIITYDEKYHHEDDDDSTVSSTYVLNGDKLMVKTTTEYTDFTGPQKTIVTSNLERVQ